ncbi:MAG TPA: hypothetical protein VFV75_07385 [Candidatus Polarisedimenticolaceae bacterium]|nr:hypothetical protein [Candidatus Polarisedimenticolaceae bacterium]
MELRPENLTLLQRHLLSLLAKVRQGQRPPWLMVEVGRVRVEPLAQVLSGRAASVAAKGLKATGWLRARPSGGLELAHAPATVVALLDTGRKSNRDRGPHAHLDWQNAELDAVIEQAVTTYLAFAEPEAPSSLRSSVLGAMER